MDAETGEIVAAELTTNAVDDASRVGPLLGQLAGSVASFTGDGAYDQDGSADADRFVAECEDRDRTQRAAGVPRFLTASDMRHNQMPIRGRALRRSAPVRRFRAMSALQN
jgi:hypothetical protein